MDVFLHAGEDQFDVEVMGRLRKRFLAGRLEEGHFRYVGFQIIQNNGGILLDQTNYVEEQDVFSVIKSSITLCLCKNWPVP